MILYRHQCHCTTPLFYPIWFCSVSAVSRVSTCHIRVYLPVHFCGQSFSETKFWLWTTTILWIFKVTCRMHYLIQMLLIPLMSSLIRVFYPTGEHLLCYLLVLNHEAVWRDHCGRGSLEQATYSGTLLSLFAFWDASRPFRRSTHWVYYRLSCACKLLKFYISHNCHFVT